MEYGHTNIGYRFRDMQSSLPVSVKQLTTATLHSVLIILDKRLEEMRDNYTAVR